MDLERLLTRLDRNPFESMAKGRTRSIYALSDPKFDSIFFNETSWQGLVDLHKELPGPILIAGGLFDSCKYFFTKAEVVKFPRHAYKGGEKETISDELAHKKELAVDRLKQLGPGADIQYFYGPKDVKNIIELYNERINIYTSKIQTACKGLRAIQVQLERLEGKLERMHTEEDEVGSLCKALPSIEHFAETAIQALNELSANLPCGPIKEHTEKIYHAAEEHVKVGQYLKATRQGLSCQQRITILREYNQDIGMDLSQIVESLSLNEKSYQMQKRDISKELRHTIIEDSKSLYKKSLEDLLAGQGGPKIKVHDWIQTWGVA